MSPEEHFRRLRNDDVWASADHHPEVAAAGAHAARARTPQRDRGPIWVTAVVGASLVVLTVAAVHGTGPAARGHVAAAPAAPATGSAAPIRSATPSPTPTDTRSVDPTDPSLRSVLFYPNDPADMTRAKTIIACFKKHGVRIVGLVPSENDPSIKAIGYGGVHNDHASIMTGLKYQDECFKAGGPVR